MSVEEGKDTTGYAVVHRGAPEAVGSMLARLLDEELDAVALDEPNFIVRLIAFGTYRVRIAVPREQEARAKEVIAEWDRAATGTIEDLAREVRRQFLVALTVGVLACLPVLALDGGWGRRLPWLAGVFSAGFLLTFLAIAARQRSRSG